VIIYNQDLQSLADVPTASLDAIVAISALEHNTPEGLVCVVAELMRVLKPGGALLATLGAARTKTGSTNPPGLVLHGGQFAPALLPAGDCSIKLHCVQPADGGVAQLR
jgi:SAM-dependent methyltransferase